HARVRGGVDPRVPTQRDRAWPARSTRRADHQDRPAGHRRSWAGADAGRDRLRDRRTRPGPVGCPVYLAGGGRRDRLRRCHPGTADSRLSGEKRGGSHASTDEDHDQCRGHGGSDRRGCGACRGQPARPGVRPGDRPGDLDLAAFTRQALAAYRALAAQPESDPGALIIAGHSEGGMQALLLARAARPAPAGLVLLEPQDMRLLDLVRLQIDGQLDAAVAAGQYDPAQAATDKAVLARLVTDFHARRPLRYTGMSPNLADF